MTCGNAEWIGVSHGNANDQSSVFDLYFVGALIQRTSTPAILARCSTARMYSTSTPAGAFALDVRVLVWLAQLQATPSNR